jgi:hypothetical protein
LRQVYDRIASEPLPDSLRDVLARLDQSTRG